MYLCPSAGSSFDERRKSGRSRSKSPFRSFRWPKKSKAPALEGIPGGGYASDDESNYEKFKRKGIFNFWKKHGIGKSIFLGSS